MTESVVLMFMAGVFGFVVSAGTVPVFARVASRYGVVARPTARCCHERPTPLLGGLAIFLPFILVCCLFLVVVFLDGLDAGHPHTLQMVSLFLGVTWIMILGTIDDKVGMKWWKKLLGQFVGVLILVLGGHSLGRATIPIIGVVDFGWFGIPLFALIILTVTNAVNLIDGLDGLAGGICFFAAVTSGVVSFAKGDMFSAVIGFTVAGSLLGFLCYNFPPASVYMGDGGSLPLGFLMGTLATSFAAISPGQRSATMTMLLVPFFPLTLALLDVVLTILRRWITGRRLFQPDADHLHHRLLEKFRRPRVVVGIIYGFSALLSAMTLCLALGTGTETFTAMVEAFGLVMLVAVVVAMRALRLYRLESIPSAIKNRPYFKFLADYQTSIGEKVCSAGSLDAVMSLLISAARDLNFDKVEIILSGRVVRNWHNSNRLHPEMEPVQAERHFPDMSLTVKWAVPNHESVSYQKYLKLTWDQLLDELASQIECLATNHDHPVQEDRAWMGLLTDRKLVGLTRRSEN